MKHIIILLGILFILAGASLLFDPNIVFGWMEDNMENDSLYIFAIAFRILLGIILLIGAKASKYPRAVRFFGYLVIIAALIFIFMGREGFQDLLASSLPAFKPYAPVSGLVGMALGGFLIYAFSGKREPNSLLS